MNRRRFVQWGCAQCALIQASAAVRAAEVNPAFPANGGGAAGAWTMPQRFVAPDAGSDEGGLWALMAREEQRLRRSPFLMRDPGLQEYLQQVACRLGGDHCPDMRVYPVRNAQFNANMAPNGMMQVWSGLLLRMENEAQLAAVLGHEIGHFLQRHALERLRDAKSRSAAGVLLAPFGLVGLAGQLALIAGRYAYSRDQERDADAISVRLMASAGYDTAQAPLVWSNLLAEIAARPNADAATSSVLFATHPPSDERREALAKLAVSGGDAGEAPFRQRMTSLQYELLDDELKRGQFEETIALLDRKIVVEPDRADLRYFRGESRRLRAQDGDLDRARAELVEVTRMNAPPPQAWRSLGLVLRAGQDHVAAAEAFKHYLELAPEAPDAGLITRYLSDLQP